MKSKRILLLFLLILLASSYGIKAATVAVVDFTNNTGYYLPGIEEAAAEFFTTYLISRDDYQVVERAKLNSIVTEHGLNTSGLIEQTNSAIELGRLLGAEYILTGSLMNLDIEENSFSGYGIKTNNITMILDTNIKLISVNTGLVEVGDIYSSSSSYQGYTSHSIKVNIESKVRTLLKTTAQNFVRDLESRDQDEGNNEEIFVEFNSTPAGASIEIDGIYYGSTPARIPVTSGIHKVLITMGGYEPWDKKVNFYEGFVVDAHLGIKEEKEDGENE